MRGWFTTVLLLAALAAATAALHRGPVRPPDVTASASDADGPPPGLSSAGATAITPPGTYQVALDRPLFHPSRRPPPPARDAVPQSAAGEESAPRQEPLKPPPAVELVGTVLRGELLLALVRSPDGAVTSLSGDDELDGWRVSAIAPTRLVLRLGTEAHEVWLRPPPERRP